MGKSISLCMVTYNEGHRIYKTLGHAAPHVHEIVVVDQLSTDNTLSEIDRFSGDSEIPVIVVEDKHWGFCEPSRKLAHANSSGEWILVLDADERVSEELAEDMKSVGESEILGHRVKRSLWLSGLHHFTGDYQYRLFDRNAVEYLDEIHTEPQPTSDRVVSRDYVGIWHEKSWTEQVRDENAYVSILKEGDPHYEDKMALNVHVARLQELGVSAEEMDLISVDERKRLLGFED